MKDRRTKDAETILRRAIAESGETVAAIARATGLRQSTVQRFAAGNSSISLSRADKLFRYLGLAVRPERIITYAPMPAPVIKPPKPRKKGK
ncbi:MAG: helix-turn-helix domain-containing protein [Pirellulaceae bacterium]